MITWNYNAPFSPPSTEKDPVKCYNWVSEMVVGKVNVCQGSKRKTNTGKGTFTGIGILSFLSLHKDVKVKQTVCVHACPPRVCLCVCVHVFMHLLICACVHIPSQNVFVYII